MSRIDVNNMNVNNNANKFGANYCCCWYNKAI